MIMSDIQNPELTLIRQNQLAVPEDDAPDFEAVFGESLARALDLTTWTRGEDWLGNLDTAGEEFAGALAQEKRIRQPIREKIFPTLSTFPDAPSNAGVYRANRQHLEKVYSGLLFNGQVEACDATMVTHDTLPLTITQIGVCLVSYNGEQGSWAHRFFRRDLRTRIADPVEEALEILERREKRKAQEQGDDPLSELAGRGIMAYAERAILRDKSKALWRMGHGNPAPYELLTGWWTNRNEYLRMSLDLIQWYVDHKRFIFVPSAPRRRELLTIGQALYPLEFAIVQTLKPSIERLIKRGHYAVTRGAMEEFCNEVAPKIVVGIYRVWDGAPPYIFYAHEEYAEMAAHIAIADSLLQEHRGFPMMIDLADTVCRTTFGLDAFVTSVQSVYADAGEPFRYLGERETRSR
ncbi:hypothetical protein ANRL1_04443 [Anaerolineae bacterium]|nr:hypothetical protein ANRL1_04443 [Anaerolineae bacterium]